MANEPERWRQWLEQHGPALTLFARQWSATITDAEDAAQSGFLKFWTTRSRANDEVAYLYACVRTAAMDIGRGDRRREKREIASVRPDESAFEPAVEKAERHAAIEAALNQLPGDQREVIVLKIWAGLTLAQIAQAIGVPLNTAASRYRYALARLEAELSESKETARE